MRRLIKGGIAAALAGVTLAVGTPVFASDIIFDSSANAWQYINNAGKADNSYTGVTNNKHGWWYVKNGKVDFRYNGFANNQHGWWYIENGKVTFKKSEVTQGTVNGQSGWWNVKGSKVIFNESIEPNKHGWWYVNNGKVDFSKTSVEHNEHGWWYVNNGKVDFSKTSVEQNRHGWWYVKNGKVDFSYTGVKNNKHGWWYIKNGKVDFSYTGLANNEHGWWYIKNGKVDFTHNGWVTNENGTWYVRNGKVDFTVKSGGKTIVIDPGHQAKGNYSTEPVGPGSSQMKAKVTSGTQGVATGVPEYKLTLAVSLKLRDELESRGYKVIMTRQTHDVNISNAQRAQIANSNNAAALIRIHANGSSNSNDNGAMTICQTKNNPFNGNLYTKSYNLSKCVLSEFCKSTGAKYVKIWETDTMTGINWAKVPSTILEMGYMSNPAEDRRMQDTSYQNKMVKGIANGIDAFFR